MGTPSTYAPHALLGYALQPALLAANAALVLARLVASYLPVYGRIAHFLLWIATYRYAYALLHSTAEGHRTPPEGAGVVDSGLTSRHGWLQTLLLAGTIAAGLYFGALGTVLAVLLVGALLPGAAIALTVAQNLVAALDPRSWVVVARKLGATYAALALAGVAIGASQALAGPILAALAPRWLGIVAYYAVADVLVFVYFHALGLALRAHADALGYTIRAAGLPPLRMRTDDADTLARARASLGHGDSPAARAELAHAVEQGAGLDVNARYRELLVRANDSPALVEHARRYACQLLASGDTRAALALAQDALARDGKYVPRDEADAVLLVDAALAKRLADVALALTANIAGARPKWRELPALAERVALCVAAWPGHVEEAIALLDRVAARVPEGPGRDAVERVRGQLEQRVGRAVPRAS